MARTAEEIAALKKKREEVDATKRSEERSRSAGRAKRLRMTDGDLLRALKLTDAELDGLMDKDIRRRFQQLLPRKPQLVAPGESLAESSSEAAAD